ncbi:MAG: MAPEG family protein [Gammaproteobacteria bacterium]|jgi:hypothetical protein|nr:hypothetical protein [Gammaproteobacteria bacterium]MDP6095325.1 MAPEG family protein [Gammaproteobacteria bacterium]MDP7455216.1 MAPEG family protein [Gammaproteobacteria bacterium]HJO11523.1 MAPEG family protein [Gammaproteobacteria bacterium]|tara:strand:+ start:7524 stop:7916 length:393 start_codon:yes stop_codon:yes gene_type:complete
MNVAMMSGGLLGVLLFALSLNVSLTRTRMKRGFGMEADTSHWLTKSVRAQANAAEYTAIFIGLMLILEFEGSPNYADQVYIAVIVSRYLHAAGMLLSKDLQQPHPLRFIGSLGTYICGFILCGTVIRYSL